MIGASVRTSKGMLFRRQPVTKVTVIFRAFLCSMSSAIRPVRDFGIMGCVLCGGVTRYFIGSVMVAWMFEAIWKRRGSYSMGKPFRVDSACCDPNRMTSD